LLLLGVPQNVHEGALVSRELGGPNVLKRRVEVLVEISPRLVSSRCRGIKCRYSETVVSLGESILRLLVHFRGSGLLSGQINRFVVVSGARELLLLTEVIDE
jgi:hypothetical protein